MKKIKFISIIITTYNSIKSLELILKSLNSQDSRIKFEVIIANDGSSYETEIALKNECHFQKTNVCR